MARNNSPLFINPYDQPKTSINMFFLVVKVHESNDYIWSKMESSFTQYQQLDHYQKYNFILRITVKHHFSHFLGNQQNNASLKVNLLLSYQPNQQTCRRQESEKAILELHWKLVQDKAHHQHMECHLYAWTPSTNHSK
jgi:hypothetical protein